MKKINFILLIGTLLILAACSEEVLPVEQDGSEEELTFDDEKVEIPAIQLPKDTTNADMAGLIVYNGKVYTQTNTEINVADAEALIDDKLGTTKGSIDEWSSKKAFDEELASTIGEMDVYSVKGYDKGFRIMVFQGQDVDPYAEFYENLNDITINSGEDVFGKLNMVGNVASAQWRTFNERNAVDNYKSISDMELLDTFLKELQKTKPFLRELQIDPINTSRNDEEYRELTVNLQDGSEVVLTLLKDRYIYYGFADVYFEMTENIFSKMWNQLELE